METPKTKLIKVDDPKQITIQNLLHKLRMEAPNGSEMLLTFDAPSIPMSWEMVIWYGFIWKGETPSEDPIWCYAFRGTSQTQTFHKERMAEILRNVDAYRKLGTLKTVTLEYEEWN